MTYPNKTLQNYYGTKKRMEGKKANLWGKGLAGE